MNKTIHFPICPACGKETVDKSFRDHFRGCKECFGEEGIDDDSNEPYYRVWMKTSDPIICVFYFLDHKSKLTNWKELQIEFDYWITRLRASEILDKMLMLI